MRIHDATGFNVRYLAAKQGRGRPKSPGGGGRSNNIVNTHPPDLKRVNESAKISVGGDSPAALNSYGPASLHFLAPKTKGYKIAFLNV